MKYLLILGLLLSCMNQREGSSTTEVAFQMDTNAAIHASESLSSKVDALSLETDFILNRDAELVEVTQTRHALLSDESLIVLDSLGEDESQDAVKVLVLSRSDNGSMKSLLVASDDDGARDEVKDLLTDNEKADDIRSALSKDMLGKIIDHLKNKIPVDFPDNKEDFEIILELLLAGDLELAIKEVEKLIEKFKEDPDLNEALITRLEGLKKRLEFVGQDDVDVDPKDNKGNQLSPNLDPKDVRECDKAIKEKLIEKFEAGEITEDELERFIERCKEGGIDASDISGSGKDKNGKGPTFSPNAPGAKNCPPEIEKQLIAQFEAGKINQDELEDLKKQCLDRQK